MYYGPLEKERKYSNYLRFKNNEVLIMLATKAFGMGIDIPDIANVYHFAPTGNVCDYIQEIGRVARELDQGYAYFDFLPKDFVHVKVAWYINDSQTTVSASNDKSLAIT